MKAPVGIVLLCFFAQTTAIIDGEIRLAGTNSDTHQGRVEIYKYNVWGTICSRYFRLQEAKVVCRQLGFPENQLNLSIPITNANTFGPGTGRILLDDITCFGMERRLLNCMFTYWNNACTHADDVGVVCRGTTAASTYPPPVWTTHPSGGIGTGLVKDYGKCNPQSTSIRLVHPASLQDAGVVQVYRNGQWGTICDTNWDRADAQVACRMLCYNPADAVPGSDNFATSNIAEAVTLTNFGCNGAESDLIQCPQSSWTYNVCGRHKAARVTCAQMTSRPTPIAPPALDCDNGQITVNFTSAWTAFVPYSVMKLVWPSNGPCSAITNNQGAYVTFSIPFDECGTQISTNATHIFYKNAILYVPKPTGIITRIKTYMIYLQCVFPRDYTVHQGIIPVTDSIAVSAPGKYQVLMHFYTDQFVTKYTHYPAVIPIGNWLNVGIELVNNNHQVQVVVRDCYSTPSVNRLNLVQYKLFTNKCQNDPTVSFHHISQLLSGFRYQTFKFVNYRDVYIHCNVYICPENDTSIECDRTCRVNAVGRRRRRESPIEPIYVRSNLIRMEDPENVDEPRPTAQPEASVTKDNGAQTAATTMHPVSQQTTTHEPDTIIHITNGLPDHNKRARPTSKTVIQQSTKPLADNITGQSTYLSTKVTDAIDNDEIPIKQTPFTAANLSHKPTTLTSTSGEPAEPGLVQSLVGSGSASCRVPLQYGFHMCLVVLGTVIAGLM